MRKIQRRRPGGINHLISRVSDKIQPFIEKVQKLLAGKTRLKKGKGPITGVSQGIAEYFDIPPILVRLGFGVAAIFSWWTILAYGVLAFFLPKNEYSDDPWEDALEEEWEDEPSVVDLNICEHCNSAVKPYAVYCHHCGAKLEPAARIPFD